MDVIQNDASPSLRVLSLGGGVQSTVMALLAERGTFHDTPDAAIFADTGWEPSGVYENIEWLKGQVSFPIITTSNGRSLKDDLANGVNASGTPWISVPVFMKDESGRPSGMGRRQCTKEYKIRPILREARRLMGVEKHKNFPPRKWIEMWLGISTDEIVRMKPSLEKWVKRRYPLVEDVPMSRTQCLGWFADHYPDRSLSKSSCVGCPYHGAHDWVKIRDQNPIQFFEAVELDKGLRDPEYADRTKMRGSAFLHRKMVPLDEAVDLDVAELERIAQLPHQLGMSLFDEECEGHCEV